MAEGKLGQRGSGRFAMADGDATDPRQNMGEVPILSRRTNDEDEERRAAVEGRVFDATESLLSDGTAYAGLSIERITSAAGLSRTGFYDYFRDKRDLLMRLFESRFKPIYGATERFVANPELGPLDVGPALRFFFDFVREHQAVFAACVEASGYDEVVAEFCQRLCGGVIETVAVRLAREQAAGRVLDMDVRPTVFALVWSTWNTCYELLRHGDSLPPEERMDSEQVVAALALIWSRSIWGAEPAP